MYKQNPILVKLLEPVISALGYEMWGIEMLPSGRGSLVRVYIDNETGITLADCERVSEQVTGLLDVHDPIAGSYRLEVSSPGLDRLFFKLEQFRGFIGQQVQLRLGSPLEGRRNIAGRIGAVHADDITIITIENDGPQYTVPAEMIDRARLVLPAYGEQSPEAEQER